MPEVNWIAGAGDGLGDELRRRLCQELRTIFEGDKNVQITITGQFRGFSWAPGDKSVLGVEVRDAEDYRTHIVKLGKRSEVAPDYDGWLRCIRGQNFASRILVRLRKFDLPDDRVAVVYQDAYSLFGDGPKPLEDAVIWSVTDHKPEPTSVERAIYQIFTDLNRWCYRHAVPNAGQAERFYKERLDFDETPPGRVFDKWAPSKSWIGSERHSVECRWTIRRDALWLFRGQDPPDPSERLRYIDALDFVRWAIETQKIPETLVGKSHGDLHGRNVLVGVERDQVDYPAVFDYGEMGEANVVMWDFVKLETELKVRLLPKLYDNEKARRALLGDTETPSALNGSCEPVARKNRLRFTFEFESRLAALTRGILSPDHARSMVPNPPPVLTGDAAIDRALAILLRIRKEAALWTGFQRLRNEEWRDEYYFCSAVYGLCNPKWRYTELETECAVISAGVGAANVRIGHDESERLIFQDEPPQPPYPSYFVPTVWAYRKWKGGDWAAGLDLLSRTSEDFAHAVPLRQIHALLLVEASQHEKATELLEKLRQLCLVFRDHEALSRLGRISKDWADKELERELAVRPIGLREIRDKARPAWQWYRAAFEDYQKAFEVSGEFYPAVNAATLAHLIGQTETAQQLARRAQEIAKDKELDCWVFASEGEAALLLDDVDGAVSYYCSALRGVGISEKQVAQSMYKQLCRLWWALGAQKVDSVVRVFRDWEQANTVTLKAGPLGDCGRVVPPANAP